MKAPILIVSFLVAILFVVSSVLSQSNPPVWVPTFTQTFQETTKIFSSHHTNGTYYYDYAHSRQRIDRDNGAHDRYCGSVHSGDTPCTQLVINAKRYIIFPKIKSCCMCCTAEKGCGLLSPNWLQNATYVGEVEYGEFKVSKWDKKGLQNNYYYQLLSSKTPVPVAIDQQPNDLMEFNPLSFNTQPISDSLFELPSYCKDGSGGDNSCPFFSICTIANMKHN